MAKKGLGRGLDALFTLDEKMDFSVQDKKEFEKINIAYIEPNREQPRKNFDKEELEALAESIKNYGIIQPITVKDEGNGFFGIIAGERRYRAAKMAGLTEVPVRVVKFSPKEELEISLVENLQRLDLNPVEEALGYKKLMEEYNMTQEEVSIKVGKSRSAVANALRLLLLPIEVLKMVEEKALTAGHAKAILLVKEEVKRVLLAEKIISEELSVREAEKIAGILNSEKKNDGTKSVAKVKSPEVLDIERVLSERLGTRVLLDHKKKGGKISIEYYDSDQLEDIIACLKSFNR